MNFFPSILIDRFPSNKFVVFDAIHAIISFVGNIQHGSGDTVQFLFIFLSITLQMMQRMNELKVIESREKTAANHAAFVNRPRHRS